MAEQQQLFGTIRQAARRFGLGEKLLRRIVKAGAIPLYSAACNRPRVAFSEVERWLRSTRMPVTPHAQARVAEILERERLSRGAP